MEAPATDKEGAGQEAEEEPEEGTYVFIKKNITSNKPADFKTGSALNFRFKDSWFFLLFTIFYLPFIWK